jgi:hypothetical protein
MREGGHEVAYLAEALCHKLKAAGSSPDKVIEFFNLPNPSSCTMALEFTQLLTEMSTGKCFCGVERGWRARLTTLLPSVSRLSRQYGILNISQPHMPPWHVTGIAFWCEKMINMWQTRLGSGG